MLVLFIEGGGQTKGPQLRPGRRMKDVMRRYQAEMCARPCMHRSRQTKALAAVANGSAGVKRQRGLLFLFCLFGFVLVFWGRINITTGDS